jgi:tRNA dimethylallyltransferase
MQLYKGMDIGTAKLSVAERQGVPHHLLDVLEVTEDANVAWYQSQARAQIAEIHNRGKSVVIVGGTGLYIKAILDELNFPDTDPAVREALEQEVVELGSHVLFERLEKLDPAAALAIDRANTRRIVRALEVIEITGKPFTANLPRKDSELYPAARQFGLVMDRDLLAERISDRVDRMYAAGLVEEVDQCISAGITSARTAQLALGYAQVIAMRRGDLTLDAAIEETKRATRQYARRQETWFSRDARIKWISPIQPRLEIIMQEIG